MRSWLFWGALALNNVGLFVELVFTVFLTYEFFKRHSKLQHAYYYILYITYIVDILASIAFIVREANGNKKTTPMVGAANAVRWYYYFSPGIWELMFAINRYTAICLPGLHSRMWSGKTLILMLAIVLAFPFLINGYVWLHHPYCIFFEKLRTCYHSLILKLRMSFIINVFLIIVALFVVIIGVLVSHNNVASHALARVEYKMIVYTVISTLLFIPQYICLLFTFVFESEKYVFYEWTMVLYFLQHYVPIMLLPIMNVIYRKAFIEFVRLLIFRRNKVITISSTNVT